MWTVQPKPVFGSGRCHDSTTLQSAYELAEKAVGLAYDILTGKKEHEIIMVDCPLITQENVEEYIEVHRRAGNIQ